MPTRLIDELVRRTSISREHRQAISTRQEEFGGSYDTAILELGLVPEADILPALGSAYGFATADHDAITTGIETKILRRFPEQLALKHHWVPLCFEENQETLKLLCTAPPDLKALREVGQLLDLKLKPVLTTEIRVYQRQALLYEHTPPERILKLLQSGGGLGDEAIQGPSSDENENRPSLIQTQPLTFAEATRQLLEAQTRDEIVDISLFYTHRSFSYVAFLAVKQGLIKGWRAVGPGHKQIEDVDIDPTLASSFATAYQSSAQVLGPPQEEDLGYLNQMGRNSTRSLVLIPLRLNDKVFSLLYADNDSAAISPHLAAEMMVFAHHVQKAMERIILQRKGVRLKTPPLPVPPLAEASEPPADQQKVVDAKPVLPEAEPGISESAKQIVKTHEKIEGSFLSPEMLKPRIEPIAPAEEETKTPPPEEDEIEAKPSNEEDDSKDEIKTLPTKEDEIETKPLNQDAEEQTFANPDENISDAAWAAEIDAVLEEESDISTEDRGVSSVFGLIAPTSSKTDLPPFSLPDFPSSQLTPADPLTNDELTNKPIPVLPNLAEKERLASSPLLQSAPPPVSTSKPTKQEKTQNEGETSNFGLRPLNFEAPAEETISAKPPESFEQKQNITESNGFSRQEEIPTAGRPGSFEGNFDITESNAFRQSEAPIPLSPAENVDVANKNDPVELEPASFDHNMVTEPVPPPEETRPPSSADSAAVVREESAELNERPTDLEEIAPEHVKIPEETPDDTLVGFMPEAEEYSDTLLNAEPVSFDPSLGEIKEWIDALNHKDPLTRKQAMNSPIAKHEQVLPLLKESFPGVIDVDPRTAGLTLPPFSECGALLKVMADFQKLAHPYVEPFVDDSKMTARFFATYFYSECHVPQMIPKLIRRLHDGDPRISVAAENSLFEYREDPAFEMVIKHLHARLKGTSVEARKRAITCIANFKDTTAIEALINVLEKNEKTTSASALLALEEICRQSWGLNVKKWKNWWSKNRDKTRTEWLIDALESKDQNVREKAITELEEISGETLGYFATGSWWSRSKAVGKWRAWLKTNRS